MNHRPSIRREVSIVFALVLTATLNWTASVVARPTLRGPGGLITTPTAYVSSGGTVAPQNMGDGNAETVTSINYAWKGTAELAMQKPTYGETGVSLKYQFTQDVETKNEDTAATAIGFLDLPAEDSKAFYGVMSKKAASMPFVLHLGIMSERSLIGNVKPFCGFETILSKQFLFIGEYDGLHRDVNSGFLYHMTQNVGSFIYFMDVGDAGLTAETISGFTFKVAF